MNCGYWEYRIALYAGGDLAVAEASEVERHIGECAGCQMLLSGLREELGLLREVHAEPLEEAHFAAVRARVMAELERARRPFWRWAWVCAAVAAAMWNGLAIRPTPRPSPGVAKVLEIPRTVEAPPVLAPPPLPARPKHVARERKPAETVMVKLETNDPDVVIYWIAETKGEPK